MTQTSKLKKTPAPKARPILFAGSMVRASLEERKTRRKLYVRKGEDPTASEHLARRLANGLDSAVDGECWNWTRSTNGCGYGTLRVAGRTVYAHRLALELSGEKIPESAHVLHACDNPRCINPAHLSTGTRSDNMKDAVTKGRLAPVPVSFPGEVNPASRLSEEGVRSVRRLAANGLKQSEIAERHGISQSQVSNIVRRRAWGHVA
jgi:hypothetical protein